MDMDDKNFEPKPIDNVTDYGRGIAPEIDNRTDAGRGYPEPIDNRTDYGRGIIYKTCDGKDVATIEEVMQYNQRYYDLMKNTISNNTMNNNIEEKGFGK